MSSHLFTHIPYREAADFHAIMTLIKQRQPMLISKYPSIIDLQEISNTPSGRATLQLWQDASQAPAGFTLLDGEFFAFDISTRADFNQLAREMLAWAMQNLSFQNAAGELTPGCLEEETQRISFLENQGFTAQPVRTLHFMRSLKQTIPQVNLPEGFLIRPIAGEEEADAWVKLHRAAHSTQNMTTEFRLSMMRTPEYDRELDLVAVTPEGQLAAYVLCHFSAEENDLRGLKIGYTDPVSTHPDFQGKGLARALLNAGFMRLRECGLEFAEIGTLGENAAMIRTAESVGYQRYSSTIFFSKKITG